MLSPNFIQIIFYLCKLNSNNTSYLCKKLLRLVCSKCSLHFEKSVSLVYCIGAIYFYVSARKVLFDCRTQMIARPCPKVPPTPLRATVVGFIAYCSVQVDFESLIKKNAFMTEDPTKGFWKRA